MLRYAIAQQLTVAGGAAARLSSELIQKYPSIPWADIVGLRNILVHQYFGVHWPLVWQTVTDDVPAVLERVREILRQEFPEYLFWASVTCSPSSLPTFNTAKNASCNAMEATAIATRSRVRYHRVSPQEAHYEAIHHGVGRVRGRIVGHPISAPEEPEGRACRAIADRDRERQKDIPVEWRR
jgi:hypothetical protein